MTIKKRLIFALMQIRDWMMPESLKERSEVQMKIAKQINKLIRKLTPKEEYEQSFADCEKRAQAFVGIDSFDTPSIVGTASKD
jgi:hypothetical protein